MFEYLYKHISNISTRVSLFSFLKDIQSISLIQQFNHFNYHQQDQLNLIHPIQMSITLAIPHGC